MASTVITYTRGNTYIENTPGAKTTTATAHGLCGLITVGGHRIDAVERMDGYVTMAGGKDYPNSTMYWNAHYDSYVINPWLGKAVEATKRKNILFHPANYPSHLEGCIGPGLLENGMLTSSKEMLEFMWYLSGGKYNVKTGHVIMTLRVVGDMKSLAACTKWTA
ncbi:hypothetical protein ACQW02_08465 [Humitalea sp. 24SJ18S-53]|uniref:hypothetical protein n=1 Tax=Humitalea sp. 24SJ18S-53 TaxID=3422307 RepID=UPI003D67919B